MNTPLSDQVKLHPGLRGQNEQDGAISEACATAANEFPLIDDMVQRLADEIPGIGTMSAYRLLAAIGLAINNDSARAI